MTNIGARTSTAMPIGTLMNSVQRHEAMSVSSAAEQEPDRGATGRHGAEQGEGAVALRVVAGAGREQREHARRGQRGTDALQGTGTDEQLRRRREAAQQRAEDEDGQAELEDPEPTADVAEPATEQQQPAEGEGVGVEHPAQGGRAEPEVGVDARERDVHDGRVEHQHQLGDQHDSTPVRARSRGREVEARERGTSDPFWPGRRGPSYT